MGWGYYGTPTFVVTTPILEAILTISDSVEIKKLGIHVFFVVNKFNRFDQNNL